MHRRVDVPIGDVLVHCGDSTGRGTFEEFEDVCKWMGQEFRTCIIIPGNHDECIEKNTRQAFDIAKANGVWLLNDEALTVEAIKFYGSPWTPEFFNWSFMLPRGREIAEKWALIPEDTNILITHGPPYGTGDLAPGDRHVGCVDLLHRVEWMDNLKYHLYGHVHEGYGIKSEEKTTFVNAAICTGGYQPTNKPIVIEV